MFRKYNSSKHLIAAFKYNELSIMCVFLNKLVSSAIKYIVYMCTRHLIFSSNYHLTIEFRVRRGSQYTLARFTNTYI